MFRAEDSPSWIKGEAVEEEYYLGLDYIPTLSVSVPSYQQNYVEEAIMWCFNRDQRTRDLQERFCIRPTESSDLLCIDGDANLLHAEEILLLLLLLLNAR